MNIWISRLRALDLDRESLSTHLDAVGEPLLHGLLQLWGQMVLDGGSGGFRTRGWRRSQLDGGQLLGELQERGGHILVSQPQR